MEKLYELGIDPRILIAVVAVLAIILVLGFIKKLAVKIVLLVIVLSLSGVLSFNVTETLHKMEDTLGEATYALPAEKIDPSSILSKFATG